MEKRFYLAVGDSLLRDREFEKIENLIQKSIKGDISHQLFYLSEIPLVQVLTQAKTLPFLTAFQIFRIRDLSAFKKDSLELLSNYAERPSNSTVLFFEADALEKTHSLNGWMGKNGNIIALTDEAAVAGQQLLKQKFSKAGKSIAPSALERLASKIPDAPAMLESIADQLINYSGASGQITEEMVEKFEEDQRTVSNFSLLNALSENRTAEAVKILHALIRQGEDAYSLIGFLHWHMRRLWKAKTMFLEGQPEAIILKTCGIYFKQAPFFMKSVRQSRLEKLEQMIEELFQMDWKLKTGRGGETLPLELWVADYAG